jgi:hypothetical protein
MSIVPLVVGFAALNAANDAKNLYDDVDRMVGVTNQNLTFPTDLLSTNEERQAYCAMQFVRYRRRSINERGSFQVQSGLRLPLPSNLRETQSVSYSNKNLGPMMGAAADEISNVGQALGSNMTTQTLGSMFGSLSNIATGAAAEAYQRATSGTVGNAISAVTGLAVNPYQTVLFESPTFKKHSFSWKFIPRDENESNIIRDIIKLMKYHSSPGVLASNAVFFSYPEMLLIQFYPKQEFLYSFKPCVIDSITVNYAPNGPSLYKRTGAPTAVEITLNLTEIEMWTKLDYTY